jgi:hypothetical protein
MVVEQVQLDLIGQVLPSLNCLLIDQRKSLNQGQVAQAQEIMSIANPQIPWELEAVKTSVQ